MSWKRLVSCKLLGVKMVTLKRGRAVIQSDLLIGIGLGEGGELLSMQDSVFVVLFQEMWGMRVETDGSLPS